VGKLSVSRSASGQSVSVGQKPARAAAVLRIPNQGIWATPQGGQNPLAIARAANGLVVSKLMRQEPSESELTDAILASVSLLGPEDDAPLTISVSLALRQLPAMQAAMTMRHPDHGHAADH